MASFYMIELQDGIKFCETTKKAVVAKTLGYLGEYDVMSNDWVDFSRYDIDINTDTMRLVLTGEGFAKEIVTYFSGPAYEWECWKNVES